MTNNDLKRFYPDGNNKSAEDFIRLKDTLSSITELEFPTEEVEVTYNNEDGMRIAGSAKLTTSIGNISVPMTLHIPMIVEGGLTMAADETNTHLILITTANQTLQPDEERVEFTMYNTLYGIELDRRSVPTGTTWVQYCELSKADYDVGKIEYYYELDGVYVYYKNPSGSVRAKVYNDTDLQSPCLGTDELVEQRYITHTLEQV